MEGQPRKSEGHPCTLLDKQDVAEWKKRLATDTEMQGALAKLKETCDVRIAKSINVPLAQQNPDGTWAFPGDVAENKIEGGKVSRVNEPNAADIASLGMAYQLTGDAKYGQFAKQMIVAYADNFPHYGHPKTWTEKNWRSQQDLRLTGQFLEDGFWLNEVAYGYDMVRDLFNAAENKHVHDDLFVPIVDLFKMFAKEKRDYLSAPHNRSAVCAAGTLMAGYASDDEAMAHEALYGVGGTPEKPGGIIGVHFSEQCLLPDGLWIEGAPGYQVGILSSAVFNDAETLWHHGVDLYRFRGGALKRMLDSAITLAYPDDKMNEPLLHDSGALALLDERGWFNNEAGVPYEYGYRRYRDARYVPIIKNAVKSLSPTIHAGAPSLFQDLPAEEVKLPLPLENANFYSVGVGVLRVQSPEGPTQLLQEYGPSAGHAHPSKLAIDVYALGVPFMQFPGVIFPYNDPLDPKWFWTTLGNCALEVDEGPQVYSGNIYKFPRGTTPPVATQLVYGPASTMGVQRAMSDTIYPGLVQDRALFLAPEYVADIFGSFSAAPHKYDLAWHFNGTLTPGLTGAPHTFDAALNGYNAMQNVTAATSDKGWNAAVATPTGKTGRFVAAGGTSTAVFFGTGPQNPHTPKVPPTAMIVQRREGKPDAVFANAVDLSNAKEGYVKSAAQEGGLDAGYALLKLDTAKGTDLCFAAYKPASYKVGGLETDAAQAFVRADGASGVKALYLGGGTKLGSGGASIQRSESGLAYVEKTGDGGYIVGNPSSTPATVTVQLPGLGKLKARVLGEDGKPGAAAQVKATGDTVAVTLKGTERVGFAP